jgi:cytochrome c5
LDERLVEAKRTKYVGIMHIFPEDTMSDDSNTTPQETAHTGFIKSPKQALLAVTFAVPALVFVLIGLAYYVAEDQKPVDDAINQEQAVAARIQKVGSIEIRDANRPLRSGEDVFKAQCTTCHGTGLLGAPKFGDATAWAARIKTGYDALLNSALKGKNAMVPQGGGDFSELEIGRAVVFMANAGGAKFEEPQAAK